MKEDNPLEDIFSQIASTPKPAAPDPSKGPRSRYDPEPGPPPPATEGPPQGISPDGPAQAAPGRGAALLPWLCLLLAVMAAALAACLFQLSGVRSRLASLEEAVASVAAIDQLRKENESLVNEKGRLDAWADQKTEEAKQLQDALDQYYYRMDDLLLKEKALYYQWYIQRFMEEKDYPMAAAAVAFSADFWYIIWMHQVSVNSALMEQYQAYCQELFDMGYLQQADPLRYGGSNLCFAEKWDPGENHDMAALSILWCALDAHFVRQSDEEAAQYLCNYHLAYPSSGYQERVERLASGFTLEQFQLLKDELAESQWLTVASDGTISEDPGPADGFNSDTAYSLPFEPPMLPL